MAQKTDFGNTTSVEKQTNRNNNGRNTYGAKTGGSKNRLAENQRTQNKKTNMRQGNMALKDKDGRPQSEPHVNLQIMKEYIKQHFARTRAKWEIECIPHEACEEEDKLRDYIKKNDTLQTRRQSSNVQQYAKSSDAREKYTHRIGQPISSQEIKQAIAKLSNRKSVGKDELTAETFKANEEWITQILQAMFNQIGKNKTMPQSWIRGIMTFLHKKKAKKRSE